MTEATNRLDSIIARVRELLALGDGEALSAYLGDLHGSDVADLIEEFEPDQRVALVEYSERRARGRSTGGDGGSREARRDPHPARTGPNG